MVKYFEFFVVQISVDEIFFETLLFSCSEIFSNAFTNTFKFLLKVDGVFSVVRVSQVYDAVVKR